MAADAGGDVWQFTGKMELDVGQNRLGLGLYAGLASAASNVDWHSPFGRCDLGLPDPPSGAA